MNTAPAATVRYTREGGIGRVVLDRPPLNVLGIATLEALNGALAEAEEDRGLKVLTLAGAGRAFCAGVDIADHTEDRMERMLGSFHEAVRRLMSFDTPVVALVHGATLGGGCELALACDFILASDNLKLGQPEIQLGVFPPVAVALLNRLIGRQNTLDLVLTGRTLRADEAQVIGLVSRVFPAAEFVTASEAVLRGLASQSGAAMRLAKRAVRGSAGLPFIPALERAEDLYLNELMQLDDAREGIAAFVEKRKPVWKDPS
jgi:cyclohexa-1,5-dienecarbonyl-CoA hydratase